MLYVAIKADIVSSRRSQDRQKLQDTLFTAVAEANELFQGALASQFVTTHGDEIQGLVTLEKVDLTLGICEHFIDALCPQNIRFGVGIGRLSTKLQPTAIGMDGEAWHKAHLALEKSRKMRLTFAMESAEKRLDSDVTAMIDYMLSHRQTWTEQQREAVHLLLLLGTQQAVADHLKITNVAVSKRLTACMWHKYASFRQVAEKHLQSYARLSSRTE